MLRFLPQNIANNADPEALNQIIEGVANQIQDVDFEQYSIESVVMYKYVSRFIIISTLILIFQRSN